MYKQELSQVSETITYPSTDVTTSTVVKADIFSLLGGLGLVTALPIGVAIAWITLRPSFLVPRTNEAYVVRGARGTVVLLDGGRLLIGTRRITNVTLNEVEVKVEKHGKNDEAVRTMDSLKANIAVVFHVGVKKGSVAKFFRETKVLNFCFFRQRFQKETQ